MNTEESAAGTAVREPDSPITPEQEAHIAHDSSNCWFDGKKWIPVENMSNSHLKQAKLFAQRKEEFFWHKSTEFGKKVEMLDEEAERRGIVLKEYRSKWRKSDNHAKAVNKTL